MKRFCTIASFLCFICYGHSLKSQDLEIRTYTTLDGMSNHLLTYFYQDKFDYFWLGSVYGLDRFDGINFQHYGIRHGMPSLRCTYILEDHYGRMWVGTQKGIAEFRKDSFYVYPTLDHTQLSYVFQIYEDRIDQLIVNTPEGQFKFDGKQWEPYSILNQQNHNVVKQVVTTDDGEYLMTVSEVFYINKSGVCKLLWQNAEDSPYYYFNALHEFDNQVYVTADDTQFRIDSIHHERIFPDELKGKEIRSSFKDNRGLWWISTFEDEVFILEQKKGVVRKKILNNIELETGPGVNFSDHENQLWSMGGKGLLKIVLPSFSSLKIKEVKQGQHIRNVFPYRDHQLFISVGDGSLLLIQYDVEFNPTYAVLESYKLDLAEDFVDNYSIDHKGRMWMSTRRGELYYYDHGKLSNKTFLVTDLGQSYFQEIVCYPNSDTIVIALDSLLAIGDANKIDTLFDSDHHYVKFPRQVKILDQQLVIKTEDAEIILYSRDEKNEFHFSQIYPASPFGRHILTDPHKRLWIYNIGENISSYRSNRPSGLQLEDEIKGTADNINAIFYHYTVDANGSVWGVNNRGIQHMHKNQKQQWVSAEHVVYEISQQTYTDWFHIVESGNKIWVNLQNQLIFFDLASTERTQQAGYVVIEDVQLNNQKTDWKNFTDSVYSYFEIPVNLKLRYNQHTLTFYYNSPTTLEDQGTIYSYRLLPNDTTWSQPSGNRSVSFNQLNPAHYSFQVRSRQRGMEWSAPTLFGFTIQKPFWDKIWFRVLFLLLIAGLVAWLFRIRLQRERAKGEMKNQLLELEMRALRAQMNPHFIYNALNSIQSLVATNQATSANKYISKFAKLLRQVLENSKRSEIILSHELESLRLYVDLEKLRMDDDINFTVNVETSITPETLLIPPLVLQPFVENALWHGLTSKMGEKSIELNIALDNDWVHITITDNGIGRQKAASFDRKLTPHESTAMQVTSQRLIDFNGTQKPTPLQILDQFNPDGTPAGTRILLNIRKKSQP